MCFEEFADKVPFHVLKPFTCWPKLLVPLEETTYDVGSEIQFEHSPL